MLSFAFFVFVFVSGGGEWGVFLCFVVVVVVVCVFFVVVVVVVVFGGDFCLLNHKV